MKIKTKVRVQLELSKKDLEVIVTSLWAARDQQVSNSLSIPRSFRRTELLADVLGNVLSNP